MEILLEARDLTKQFGGLVALDRLAIRVIRKEIVGLIGPNGSGKTTLFNIITGLDRIDQGVITFDGHDITRTSPQATYRAGICRTFQRSRLCLSLSVLDNILIGKHRGLSQGLWFNLMRRGAFRREFEAAYEAARALLAVFEPRLTERMLEPLAALPMIDRRRVEICRALIAEPQLLLLDEPSAGMTLRETAALMDDIVQIRQSSRNLTIIIVEHEMSVIDRITERCIVLNFGRKIAEGPYREVVKDPQVRQAYLGED